MHVARLQPADAQQYRAFMLQAYELAADAFTSTAEERAEEPVSYWVNRIAAPAGLSAAYGAFEGQNLIGTVALKFSAKPKTRHKALVIGMYVALASRGRLGVVQGNSRAERFWTTCGYIETRRREGFKIGNQVNTLRVMFKPLTGGSVQEYLALVQRDRPQ